MAYNEKLAGRVRHFFQLQRACFEEKQMMGGICFMVNGKMCAGVHQDRLMARIDPLVYEKSLSQKGCTVMDFTGKPMRGFVFINSSALQSAGKLNGWLKLALEFNPHARTSKPKRKTKQ